MPNQDLIYILQLQVQAASRFNNLQNTAASIVLCVTGFFVEIKKEELKMLNIIFNPYDIQKEMRSETTLTETLK